MKIVSIITNADLAGAPIHLESLIRAFDGKASIEAIFGEEGEIFEKLTRRRVRIRVLPRLRSNISPKNDLVVLFQLIKLLKEISPDIVHLHSSKAAMVGRLACVVLGIPWVYTVHGWGWRGFGSIKSKLIFGAEKLLSFSSNGRYVFVSKSVEYTAVESLGLGFGRGRVIYNGVSESGTCPEASGRLRILMAARVCAAKDHETLVRAFDRVDIPSTLILCGEGTDTDDFQGKVRAWAPRRYVDIEMLGVRSDVRSLLHSINIFALISNFEALPLSIIEAMASARAVIGTDVGGVAELIEPGVNGMLVPKGGIEEIAKSIEQLADVSLRNSFGMAGRKRYETMFNELEMTNAVWNVYQEMLEK